MFEGLRALQTYPDREVPQTYSRKYKREAQRRITRQIIAEKESVDGYLGKDR
jgi:hypothetical protein